MNTPTFTFRLNVELREKLNKLSEESGHSVAVLIDACIRRALPYVESAAKNTQ